jgi:predicted ester cyclase/quinol monooxygenase YgiN
MNLEVTKYEQIWIDGLNRGDVSAADDAFAPNCVIHMAGAPEPNLSVAAFKKLIADFLVAFPDLRLTVKDQIVSGDKVATRWIAEGTHSGPLDNANPTGRQVRYEGLILDRVVGDRVVERWEQWDKHGMLKQLGLVHDKAAICKTLFRVVAKPGLREKLASFLERDQKESMEQEDGTLIFDVFRDPENENGFYVYEAYENESAFEEHKNHTPYREWDSREFQSQVVLFHFDLCRAFKKETNL